jgi:hypothetical protein
MFKETFEIGKENTHTVCCYNQIKNTVKSCSKKPLAGKSR